MRPKLSILLLLVFASVSFQNVLATQTPPGKIVWQVDKQFVSLVPQDGPPFTPENDHPVEVSIDTLAEMLFVVSISEKKSRFTFGGKRADIGAPLFTEYEVDALSRVFAEALRSASPQQDILFRIRGGKPQLGGLTSRIAITTGRAFWRDNRLHIIFGEVQTGDKTKWLYGQKQKDTYKRKFGSRTAESDRVNVVFASVPGITQYKDSDDKIRLDWITIDPDVVLGKAPETQQPATTSQQPATNTTAVAPTNPSQRQDLKQRLAELKELREEGLISEELYQQKVQELVDETY